MSAGAGDPRVARPARWRRPALAPGVPVLMYHAFDRRGDGRRYVVSKRRFALQMRVLTALRYRAIAPEELARAVREHRPFPPRAVAITIDDGYRDNLEIAQPILARRGLAATLFLVSRRLGGVNDWDQEGELADRALLSCCEAIRMRDGGVSIGAHTRTHASLPDALDQSVQEEVAGSRADLERDLEVAVSVFSYPHGRHDARSVAAAAAAGFLGAFTTHPRRAVLDDDPMLIPRIEIRGTDSLWRFIRKLFIGGA